MKKHALDDDFESPRNVVTESNVDYLSYKFDEMDLAVSWRVLTKQKLNIANGIRLENASWRTWAKQRNNLKTLKYILIFRLKDSDVTWLYGPLHTVIKEIGDNDRFAKPKVSTTEDTFGLMTSPKEEKTSSTDQPQSTNISSRPTASPIQYSQKPLKSALKKVTMSDILKRSASELQINNPAITGSSISLSEANQQLGAFSPAVIASHRQPKLRFNQYVEQCIALTSDKKKRMSNLNNEEDEDETSSDSYEPGGESDANSVIVMRRPKVRSSIKKIEPALLKTNSRSDPDLSGDESSDDEIIPTLSGHYNRRKQTKQQSATAALDWDLESAESDALVNHIINVSKGKQPVRQRDPAADRVPVVMRTDDDDDWDNTQQIITGDQIEIQAKSDYDYNFDDDDWDTHSEHIEDEPFQTNSNQYKNTRPSSVVNHPIVVVPPSNPIKETSTNSDSNSTEPYDDQSVFSQIAHWASSHFWPKEK
ncbi:hypothetical protein INT48_008784 [Thamnidium elegans]|uniref:Nitrogen regulatory protein areA GATA-like domain-containing protein n=1 Tax=Thamnidium elegans TaxID=101142 RepID=A0A8H7SJ80_9FUNG|nr:hypothetical protein INT48_008784 [Thamnidium elegans]